MRVRLILALSICLISFLLVSCGSGGEGDNDPKLNFPDTSPNGDAHNPVGVAGDWGLAWHDEFNIDGAPNPHNWGFETGFLRNNEAQWYTPEQAEVKNGSLIITAERIAIPNQYGNAKYISASLTTANDTFRAGLSGNFNRTFLYGVIEARIKIPTVRGVWPALWALNTEFDWPAGGEIDIMEYYRGTLLFNIMDGMENWDSETVELSSLRADWANDFHVWTMEWDSEKIDLYLDGILVNNYQLSNANQGSHNPFRHPFFLILNLAIGGTSGGDPSEQIFPVQLEVDWIRAFIPR